MSLTRSRVVWRSPCQGFVSTLNRSVRMRPISQCGQPDEIYRAYGIHSSYLGRILSSRGLKRKQVVGGKKSRASHASLTSNAPSQGESPRETDIVIIGSGIGGQQFSLFAIQRLVGKYF